MFARVKKVCVCVCVFFGGGITQQDAQTVTHPSPDFAVGPRSYPGSRFGPLQVVVLLLTIHVLHDGRASLVEQGLETVISHDSTPSTFAEPVQGPRNRNCQPMYYTETNHGSIAYAPQRSTLLTLEQPSVAGAPLP